MDEQELCKVCDSSLKNIDTRNNVCLDCIRQLVHIKDTESLNHYGLDKDGCIIEEEL